MMISSILSILLFLTNSMPISTLNTVSLPEVETSQNLTEEPKNVDDNPLVINQMALNLELYSSIQLQASVTTEIENYVVTYESMDPSTASVDESGFVEALKIGKTQIVASVTLLEETYQRIVEVTVFPIESDITFEELKINLVRGSEYAIKYTTSNPNIQTKDIVWNSSNPEIATVENSKIKAHKYGTVTITATIGESVASLTVNIWVPLEKIEFNPKNLEIHMGNEMELPKIIYVPFDTSVNRDVTYKSTNVDIVDVVDGMIVPKSIGSAEIVAKVGDKETTLTVKVKARENEFGAAVIQYRLVETYEDHNVFAMDNSLLDTNTLFALNLPVKETLDAMDKGKVIEVIIPTALSASNFKRIDRFVIPSEVMNEINEQPLIVKLLNPDRTELAHYEFKTSSPYKTNLKYSIRKIAATSDLGMMVDGPSYEVKFDQSIFPEASTVKIPTEGIGSYPQAMHFIYPLDENNIPDKSALVIVQGDSTFELNLSKNRYLLAFSALSNSNDKTAIVMLSVILGSIFAIWGTLRLVKRGKNT